MRVRATQADGRTCAAQGDEQSEAEELGRTDIDLVHCLLWGRGPILQSGLQSPAKHSAARVLIPSRVLTFFCTCATHIWTW